MLGEKIKSSEFTWGRSFLSIELSDVVQPTHIVSLSSVSKPVGFLGAVSAHALTNATLPRVQRLNFRFAGDAELIRFAFAPTLSSFKVGFSRRPFPLMALLA